MSETSNVSEDKLLEELSADAHVQQMKNYVQHGKITTYDHCRNVALMSLKINRKLHLRADTEVLIRGALLHDFYLYDWHQEDNGDHNWHGFIHADRAEQNAVKYFDVDGKTRHVIRSHMWPLNLSRPPRSREAWIVCVADKVVSAYETVCRR